MADEMDCSQSSQVSSQNNSQNYSQEEIVVNSGFDLNDSDVNYQRYVMKGKNGDAMKCVGSEGGRWAAKWNWK